jgi:hypothetical protein
LRRSTTNSLRIELFLHRAGFGSPFLAIGRFLEWCWSTSIISGHSHMSPARHHSAMRVQLPFTRAMPCSCMSGMDLRRTSMARSAGHCRTHGWQWDRRVVWQRRPPGQPTGRSAQGAWPSRCRTKTASVATATGVIRSAHGKAEPVRVAVREPIRSTCSTQRGPRPNEKRVVVHDSWAFAAI